MMLVRPVRESDLDRLLELARATGAGMTSFPADESFLAERVHDSLASFKLSDPETGTTETYFLVMEDTTTGDVVGTSAVYAGVGYERPFYSYKVSTLVQSSDELNVTTTHQILYLVNDYNGSTEVGSLFLAPEYRRGGNGRLMARARYMLLAGFPQRFGELVMAEMRGWQDENGRSPFWNHLGSKFFGLGFENADHLSAVGDKRFIAELMPKYPIYVDLLRAEAREVVGKPHDSSAPALALLKKEGFQYAGYVDIFDGGPTVQAGIEEILTVRESKVQPVAGVRRNQPATNGGDIYMVSNERLDEFRVCLAGLGLREGGEGVDLPGAVADALSVAAGDPVRVAEFAKGRTDA